MKDKLFIDLGDLNQGLASAGSVPISVGRPEYKNPIAERLANTELALNALVSLITDVIPQAYSDDVNALMARYCEAQESWNSKIYESVEFSVNTQGKE
jgi:hypothetical protein